MEEFESLAEDCSQWYNLLHLESKHVCISALIGLLPLLITTTKKRVAPKRPLPMNSPERENVEMRNEDDDVQREKAASTDSSKTTTTISSSNTTTKNNANKLMHIVQNQSDGDVRGNTNNGMQQETADKRSNTVSLSAVVQEQPDGIVHERRDVKMRNVSTRSIISHLQKGGINSEIISGNSASKASSTKNHDCPDRNIRVVSRIEDEGEDI